MCSRATTCNDRCCHWCLRPWDTPHPLEYIRKKHQPRHCPNEPRGRGSVVFARSTWGKFGQGRRPALVSALRFWQSSQRTPGRPSLINTPSTHLVSTRCVRYADQALGVSCTFDNHTCFASAFSLSLDLISHLWYVQGYAQTTTVVLQTMKLYSIQGDWEDHEQVPAMIDRAENAKWLQPKASAPSFAPAWGVFWPKELYYSHFGERVARRKQVRRAT